MSNSLVEKQTKDLVSHMNDYQKASQLKQKGEAAIFDKHRLSDGQFADGLKDDLMKYRKAFSEEWGMGGWRNTQFVKKQIEEAQRPTENQIEDMYQENQSESVQAAREDFLNDLHNSQKPKDNPRPKMR